MFFVIIADGKSLHGERQTVYYSGKHSSPWHVDGGKFFVNEHDAQIAYCNMMENNYVADIENIRMVQVHL